MNKFFIFLKKKLGIYKGKFEDVYTITGTWNIKYGDKLYSNEYSHYTILYNDYTGKYSLKVTGYEPKSHHLYPIIFEYMRRLNDGLSYVKGGKIYDFINKSNKILNGKSIDTLNETECMSYLTKAVEDEDYELAANLRERLKTFN